jgi:ribonuclease P protein subunit POP4
VLPKQGSVFAFAVPLYSTEPDGGGGGGGSKGGADEQPRETETVLDGPHVEIELYGNQFCFRAADRAGRKFKHKETVEL